MELVVAVLVGVGAYIIWLCRKNTRIKHFVEKSACEKRLSNEAVTKEFLSLCKEVEACCVRKSIKIWGIKPWHLSGEKEKLNANAGFSWLPIISYTPSWISKVISDDPQWKVAFLHTMGHEMGHRNREPSPRYSFTANPSPKTCFVNYVRECRCDFYGMEFMKAEYPQYTREEVILAKEKEAEDIERHNNGVERVSSTHPTWTFRLELLRTYTCFDQAVIQRIAKETGFGDQRFIDSMVDKALFEY